jgi:hypothetical protein
MSSTITLYIPFHFWSCVLAFRLDRDTYDLGELFEYILLLPADEHGVLGRLARGTVSDAAASTATATATMTSSPRRLIPRLSYSSDTLLVEEKSLFQPARLRHVACECLRIESQTLGQRDFSERRIFDL